MFRAGNSVVKKLQLFDTYSLAELQEMTRGYEYCFSNSLYVTRSSLCTIRFQQSYPFKQILRALRFLPVDSTKLTRHHPFCLLELPVEVGQIGKAYLRRDVCY